MMTFAKLLLLMSLVYYTRSQSNVSFMKEKQNLPLNIVILCKTTTGRVRRGAMSTHNMVYEESTSKCATRL
jgi:hypothetical protein